MPGTVKSGLLADTVRLCKCDSQEIDCWTLILTLDRGHFITDFPVHFPVHVTSVSCFQHHKSHDMHCLWEISFPDHILDLLFLQKHGTEKFRVIQILP